jgi:hypothetical protein
VSLPSLRLDSFSVELADMVAETRRTGLTVAPEAASPRLRAVINKWIPDEDLLGHDLRRGVRARLGPREALLHDRPAHRARRRHPRHRRPRALRTCSAGCGSHRRAKVNTGVSTFVPKPFTPFQWAAQIDVEETERRRTSCSRRFRDYRQREVRPPRLPRRPSSRASSRARTAAPATSSRRRRRGRAVRRLARAPRLRRLACGRSSTGYDVADALRERAVDERLPWDHIDVLIPKEWFVEDWERAKAAAREGLPPLKCHKCGVIDQERAALRVDAAQVDPGAQARGRRIPRPTSSRRRCSACGSGSAARACSGT